MRKKFIFFFFLFIVFTKQTMSQVKLLATKIKKYQIDQLGNVFYIDVKNNIVKIDAISAKAINYAALSNGEAEIIDVSNPFSVLVYYPNFFKAKILDVNLSEIADYDLRSNYPNSFFSLVCTAPVNGFWAYDEFTRKLFKLDGNFQSKQQSQDIYLYTKKIIKPNYLCASKEEVFLNDPKVGILVFDFFGSYKKTIPILGLKRFSIVNEKLQFANAGNILDYQLMKIDTVFKNQNTSDQLSFSANKIYWMQSDSLFAKPIK